MKKIMTKVLSIVMAAAMCIGLVGTALADTTTTIEGTTSSSDVGTITISGVDEGLTVNAYQIAEGEYDSSTGQFIGYAMLYTAGGFSINSDGSWNEAALTEANLSALFTAAQAGGVTYSATANADGVATFSNMPVGAYLFVVTESESTVYGMIIGSVSYIVDEKTGGWATNGGTVSVSDNTYWVKSTTPTIEKVETGGDIASGDWEHGGTADVGDTLTYHITVSPIPSYEGAYPEFEVIDTIDSKLEITDPELSALKITIVGGEYDGKELTLGTDYTVERTYDENDIERENPTGFIVDFVVDGAYTLNDYVGQSLVIEYQANVISAGDVTADDADHENDVELIYATTSYVLKGDGTHYEGDETDADHDYTFNAKIQKIANDEAKTPLEGAEFTLYTDATCSTEYTQNGTVMTVASDENGYFEFTGLQAGTYYFKETLAPTGYALNTDIYTLTITASENKDGTLLSYDVTVIDANGDTVGSAIVTSTNAQIVNVKLGELPSMGGTGIALCVIAGCVVLGAAIAGVTVYRRKNNAEV